MKQERCFAPCIDTAFNPDLSMSLNLSHAVTSNIIVTRGIEVIEPHNATPVIGIETAARYIDTIQPSPRMQGLLMCSSGAGVNLADHKYSSRLLTPRVAYTFAGTARRRIESASAIVADITGSIRPRLCFFENIRLSLPSR